MSDIDLLPRADLPVIWDAFKAQVEEFRETAETLIVTDVSQKDKMELACRTRLTLRKIRIAVEHKRVELGEGHLKEIQKVNGAAKAIREFIEPLEARLLHQEGFADRFEADRIVELSKRRNDEVHTIIALGVTTPDLGKMSQKEYDSYLAALRAERFAFDESKRLQAVELEAANRLRVEAEKRLAEQAIEMRRQEEAFLEKLQAEKVAENQRIEAARILAQQERDAANWKAQQEREAAEAIAEAKAKEYQAELLAQRNRQQERDAEHQARLDAEKAVRDADLAEQKRIRDEQFAKLEAELAQERAAKQAEEKKAMELAIAPDVEKLWQFASLLRGIQVPGMVTHSGIAFASGIYAEIEHLAADIEETCRSWGLTGK